jgi:hypothetical protein
MSQDPELWKELSMCSSGDIITLDFCNIKSVDALNVDDVISHNIVDSGGCQSHVVKLRYDGELRFSWSHEGELISLATSQVGMKITRNGRIFYFSQPPRY